ncbi:MAG: 1-deoxy-D-xylulose-5-phosphate synthase [Clostridia bacterium]|nr:1-deoxy-D-xylulose-5-phosphate synthase [Clostridia bacterium]
MTNAEKERFPLLFGISSPEDLKVLSAAEMSDLAEEIRRFLIEKVTVNGGHLASNLGVVELTLAIHRVFSSPEDKILFDVGHQSYVHKLLTGRAERFDTLRQPGGLSGFPSPKESSHDPFVAGHASTSLSAALGFAEAAALSGSDRHTVAVVGDGAFTGGMIHEALNNCHAGLRLVIVLNDNEMSISRNIGLFSRYLSYARASRSYGRTKRGTKRLLQHIPLIGRPTAAMLSFFKKRLRQLLVRDNYFEDLGLSYLGPFDGHNEKALERALAEAKARQKPVILHVCTVKGKGYERAEEDPTAFHGVSPKDKKKKGKKDKKQPLVAKTGENAKEKVAPTTFHHAAANALCALAAEDASVCAVTAAMGEGTGLRLFAEQYPKRYFDVGIAEEHAATFSAGLAAAGCKPYFAVYSTFLQRAYDNLLHDVALPALPVRFLIDRASLSAADGATHHGIFDVAFLSHIPEMRLFAPATYGSLEAMLRDSLKAKGPLAIRYPNAAEDDAVRECFYPHGEYGNYGIRFWRDEEADALLLCYGATASIALAAAKKTEKAGIRLGVCLIESLLPYRPVAEKLVSRIKQGLPLFFLEEGIRAGGAGVSLWDEIGRVAPDFCASHSYDVMAIDGHFAVPTHFCDPVSFCGLDAESVATRIKKRLRRGI